MNNSPDKKEPTPKTDDVIRSMGGDLSDREQHIADWARCLERAAPSTEAPTGEPPVIFSAGKWGYLGNSDTPASEHDSRELDAAAWHKLSASSAIGAPRVGLPLLYNIVCLWAQPKDAEWFKDMAELCRLADKLLYEQGYEVSPYTVNEHQIKADSVPTDGESATNSTRDATDASDPLRQRPFR